MCIDVMGARSSQTVDPVLSRRYSSESETVLVVRRRPPMVNGGGFVVSNSKQVVVFRVDGCGVLGTKGKLLLRNGDGNDLLLIRKMVTNFMFLLSLDHFCLITMKRVHNVTLIWLKGGIVQALNMVHNKWEGFGYDNEGTERLVFTLKDPKDSCLVQNSSIKILVHGKPPKISSTRNNYVEIKGSFAERACNIMDSDGKAIAKVIINLTISDKLC